MQGRRRTNQAPAFGCQPNTESPQVIWVQLTLDQRGFFQCTQVGADRVLAHTLAVGQIGGRERGMPVALSQIQTDQNAPLGQRNFFIPHALAQNAIIRPRAHFDQPQNLHSINVGHAGLGQKLTEAGRLDIWQVRRNVQRIRPVFVARRGSTDFRHKQNCTASNYIVQIHRPVTARRSARLVPSQVRAPGNGRRAHPKLFDSWVVPFQPMRRDPLNRNRPIVCHPVHPQFPHILIQTTVAQKSGAHTCQRND